MAIALHLNTPRAKWWQSHLQSLLPELPCLLWDEVTNPQEILYAIVWRPPQGGLAKFKNLRCIVSVGAGIDHILEDTQLPKGIPIIRTTGADLTQRMREYVCLHVLSHHRKLNESLAAQQQRLWKPIITPTAGDISVGVMGLGKLGTSAAESLRTLGFNTLGWAQSQHRIDNVRCYNQQQLHEFLPRCQILVCLLPLTDSTKNILNTKLFEQLPTGASIINAGRGDHLVEEDLLIALESKKLSYATLDVFRTEPLPAQHPFWSHPCITVTPHIASMIDPETGGKEIVKNLRAFIDNQTIEDITDPQRGY